MLENIKAVLFDMDGTLVDSLWMWGDIDVEYLGKHGYEVPADLQHTIEGMSFSKANGLRWQRTNTPMRCP